MKTLPSILPHFYPLTTKFTTVHSFSEFFNLDPTWIYNSNEQQWRERIRMTKDALSKTFFVQEAEIQNFSCSFSKLNFIQNPWIPHKIWSLNKTVKLRSLKLTIFIFILLYFSLWWMEVNKLRVKEKREKTFTQSEWTMKWGIVMFDSLPWPCMLML